jgi:CheY-like chemotaxis protein/anti-sigma regulatory factor (Ser/Thr protein kinase)
VLDISRLDAGAMKPQESVFRLEEMLRQIGTDFMPLAAAKSLELRIVPSSLVVETDRNLLRRLVQNLVSNAIKYTRAGKIIVGVRRRGDLAEIQVLDSGIGIEADKLNSVFQEFRRLDDGIREAEGLGLGLSIVDRIARVLRVEIRMRSEKGKGTTASVLLPVSSAEEPRVVRRIRPQQAPQIALSGLQVIAIDNDPRILDGMRLLLEGWGCRVDTFSGLAAFVNRRQRPETPDMVLADYHLDGETGLEAIARLREIYGRALPAVLITADRSQEVRDAAEAIDVPVINKPLKPAILRTIMMRVRRMAPAAE